jgi:hypothetical protein
MGDEKTGFTDDKVKKRTKRKKNETTGVTPGIVDINIENNPPSENIYIVIEEKIETPANTPVTEEHTAKKRGRKPKGGKLIVKSNENVEKNQQIVNVILHLKCSQSELNDYNTKLTKLVTNPLEYNPMIPPTVMTYNNPNYSQFSFFNDSTVEPADNEPVSSIGSAYKEEPRIGINTVYSENKCCACGCNGNKSNIDETPVDDDALLNIKDINAKLKRLKINLYKNQNIDKKSACFWCTYEYDNPTCYIPKYEMDDKIYGYGSFCRPECAVAYLMKENLDDSTKFERYHLLNQIYSKVYNFKKNIKPAPNPYFLLDKFYGNLTIQEYRKLLKTEHMLLVIDKPLTRVLPELHEDNEDIISNINGSTTGGLMGKASSNGAATSVYKVKMQNDKTNTMSKSSIMRDKFGMV